MTPNEDKILQLMEKHKDILRCGIECDAGWIKILDPLFSSIATHVKYNNLEKFAVIQVKEKFGTLRVYTNNTDYYISGLIDMAVRMSEITCECCGQNGTRRNGPWVRTLCDTCYNQK